VSSCLGGDFLLRNPNPSVPTIASCSRIVATEISARERKIYSLKPTVYGLQARKRLPITPTRSLQRVPISIRVGVGIAIGIGVDLHPHQREVNAHGAVGWGCGSVVRKPNTKDTKDWVVPAYDRVCFTTESSESTKNGTGEEEWKSDSFCDQKRGS